MDKINFYSAENTALFWSYVKGILSTASPGVIMWFAVTAVGMLVGIIVNAVRGSQKDDDDDDFDIRHY